MKFLIGLGVIAIVIFVLWDKLAPVWKTLYGWVRFALEKIKACLARAPDNQSGKGAD